MQQRVGAEKLAVVLIDVDPAYFKARKDYIPKAKKLLERYKLDWPNAIATNGFSDTIRTFNISGYKNIVVDARGIVKGIDLHGKELDRVVDAMMKAGESAKTQK